MKYSKEFKEEALKLSDEIGLKKAAQQLGIQYYTLSDWRSKGRSYSWVEISDDGKIVLTDEMLSFLKIKSGMKLISIRSSDIAFTMGAYGPLIEESMKHEDEISGIVKKCAVIEYPKSEIGIYQAA
ncbi:transposase [Ruminococcus flavefaciens]|uniref:transposase n=1 Tax=Ruminococcus flavefaciens TaxID=1265 RepID=UPI0026F210B0|nr:transposase [Ruminococcus flavefaciens]MDD7515494.1 transposase [Ruminococcus flavefaciens]MDY5692691.1 transposase [Ruminococcus flavefaciens]